MKLDMYLFKNKITQVDFAKLLGVSRSYISRVATGRDRPKIAMARKISAATNGQVTKEELLFPEEYPDV